MSRISPPDITQDVLARSPAPARVAADKTSQAEFERALNSKPDAGEKRRTDAWRKLDTREPGKTPRDTSRPLDDDAEQAEPSTATDREPIRRPHLPGTAPETATPDEQATNDEPVARPAPEQPSTPQPPTGIVVVPMPSNDRPKPGTSHRDSSAATVKNPEQHLPIMLGAPAIGLAPETPSDQHNSSGEHDEQPPFGSLVEDPKPSASTGQTPGDKLLARLLNTTEQPAFSKDLGKLVQTLQLHIQAGVSRDGSTTLLQVNLAQLGQVDVQLAHSHGHLHVEIQASPGSLLQLQLARGDLMERLQRLNPGQPIQLTFTQQQHGGDQGSRQRRHVYDEWEQDS
ncbi:MULTISPECIES: type III secretion system needle length determinant [Pseudomonas]|uniref:type III secretion system needle length determinant n=1 Tax=Pseudomonas TaxID=286 RepID=UPI001595D9FA|nr:MULTISPECIES: type III secretion system needle length determinant [unclassified Pseudomonas]MCV2226982.1 type III secretion system needle length determinant [Pseudomonas sp. AU10]